MAGRRTGYAGVLARVNTGDLYVARRRWDRQSSDTNEGTGDRIEREGDLGAPMEISFLGSVHGAFSVFADSPIMSSCVRPLRQQPEAKLPVVLLHGFDSSCLEWSYSYPLLEDAGLETWALDVLGWGFSDLGALSRCHVHAKREHLYQLWRSYIRKPMILVGPSLGASMAIDFAVHYPKAVSKLVLINASVYAEGTGILARLPRLAAYAGVSLLKSMPLRFYANTLAFKDISFFSNIDWTHVGRLHCLMPWWEDATVDFMASGGYNVISHVKEINHESIIIWGMKDRIISNKQISRLCKDVDARLHKIPGCGHLPHVEKPELVVKSIVDFAYTNM